MFVCFKILHIRLKNNPTAENMLQTTFFARHLVFILRPDHRRAPRLQRREGIGLFPWSLIRSTHFPRPYAQCVPTVRMLAIATHFRTHQIPTEKNWHRRIVDHWCSHRDKANIYIYDDEGVCLDRWRSTETVLSFDTLFFSAYKAFASSVYP